jgi:hypothetical protein
MLGVCVFWIGYVCAAFLAFVAMNFFTAAQTPALDNAVPHFGQTSSQVAIRPIPPVARRLYLKEGKIKN